MFEDGRTTWSSAGPLIELNPDRRNSRQRFTLAHEIGHVVLGPSSESNRVAYRHEMREAKIDEEHLCDAFAAALLMPREWTSTVAARFMNPDPNLNLLRFVSHHADVSISAAAARVTDVCGCACGVIRWRNTSSGMVSTHRAALPFDVGSERLKLSSDAIRKINDIRGGSVWIDSQLLVGQKGIDARMQVSRDPSGCMMLVTAWKPSAD